MEKWKVVPSNGNYEVSSLGRVRRVMGGQGARVGHILKANPNGNGYFNVNLYDHNVRTTRLIHLVVAAAFLGPCPNGEEVNHKDCHGAHNWVGNLEYCTPKKNGEWAKNEEDRKEEFWLDFMDCPECEEIEPREWHTLGECVHWGTTP